MSQREGSLEDATAAGKPHPTPIRLPGGRPGPLTTLRAALSPEQGAPENYFAVPLAAARPRHWAQQNGRSLRANVSSAVKGRGELPHSAPASRHRLADTHSFSLMGQSQGEAGKGGKDLGEGDVCEPEAQLVHRTAFAFQAESSVERKGRGAGDSRSKLTGPIASGAARRRLHAW